MDTTAAMFTNPLVFFGVDEPWVQYLDHPVNLEDVLGFLCAPGTSSDIESLTKRYKEIGHEPTRLFTVPAEDNILLKLVWPLRHAKGCYMLGNYLGTIALCAMVAEMLALLVYEMSDLRINDAPMDASAEKGLFGRNFEKLGQERRVSILLTYGLITAEVKTHFDVVRNTRNRYLHLFSNTHDDIAVDATEIFDAVHAIMVTVLAPDVREGRIVFSNTLMRYLARKGLIKPVPPTPSE